MKKEEKELFLNRVLAFKTEKEQMQAKLDEKVRNEFLSMSKVLFDAYPELKSFGWRQYTPYFCDGEACEFNSEHMSPDINGYGYYDEVDEDAVDISTEARNNPYYAEIVSILKEFLRSFSDDDMYTLFDDHVSVKISPDGYDIEDYEHE